MMTPIAPHIEAFLRENLSHHRGASQHTCDSYGYSFQLLFEFAAARLGVTPSALALEQLDSGLVSAFLEYLEDTRRNAPETRNVRLAAIKSFFRFLEYRQPAALEQIRRVLAIPFKRTDTRLVPYLVREEVQALLDAPDPATRDGIRDRAMLHLAVCAGLRVSELTGLRIDDVALPSLSIRVHGKGTARTGATLVEDHGHGVACLAGGPGGGRGPGGVRQCSRQTAEPLGICLPSQTTRGSGRSAVPTTAEQASVPARFEAHLRDDRAARDTGHPQGVPVARTQQPGDHRNLHTW